MSLFSCKRHCRVKPKWTTNANIVVDPISASLSQPIVEVDITETGDVPLPDIGAYEYQSSPPILSGPDIGALEYMG